MRVLIVDNRIWIDQGRSLLESAEYQVAELCIECPEDFETDKAFRAIRDALENIDVLLIPDHVGEGITSTRTICLLRDALPQLPIVRWSLGDDRTLPIHWLRISCIDKPVISHQSRFVDEFRSTIVQQYKLLLGLAGILSLIDEPSDYDFRQQMRATQRLLLTEIAKLAYLDIVETVCTEGPWMLEGKQGQKTLAELMRCIADGNVTAEDVEPLLSNLQCVIGCFEKLGMLTERHQIVADFLQTGDLGKIELVRGCY